MSFDFDWTRTSNRWIDCACGGSFKERDRSAHIDTEEHARWVDSASAHDLGSFVPLRPVERPTESRKTPTAPDALAAPSVVHPPAPARSPLRNLSNHATPPKMTPGLTPTTVPLLPSSPPRLSRTLTSTGKAAAAATGTAPTSPVVPRKEEFAEEGGQ